MIETITVAGRTVEHNTVPWSVETNRHKTTLGNYWGWVEGAPGNVCWSNDGGAFNSAAARELVKQHNEWLASKKHPDILYIEAVQRLRRAEEAYNAAKEKADTALSKLVEAREALEAQ